MKVKFLGHAALLVEAGKFKALIDPYLSDNPSYVQNEGDIKGITHIFITHSHKDHVGDSMEIAKENNCMVICNSELSAILSSKNKGVQFSAVQIGRRFAFDFGTVKMTPAVHPSGYNDNGVMLDSGKPAGFIIELNGKKLYHSGDTFITDELKELKDEGIDLAFLPIGGHYTMGIDDAVKVVGYIDPKIVVPMHYNTFKLIQADPKEFKQKLPNKRVEILKSTETIEI